MQFEWLGLISGVITGSVLCFLFSQLFTDTTTPNDSLAANLFWIFTMNSVGQIPSSTQTENARRTFSSVNNRTKPTSENQIADPSLPSIAINGTKEGWGNLWGKTRGAFKYLYDSGLVNQFDWFLKVDDDTYVVMENLRYFLLPYSAETPVFYGCKFYPGGANNGYMSGGAGYVLSREAVRRFATKAYYANTSICSNALDGLEDVNMGICLERVGVIAGDSRDSFGHHRFLPMALDSLIIKNQSNAQWLNGYSAYKLNFGNECCSDLAITFHYTTPEWMHVLDQLIYGVHRFGAGREHFLLSSTENNKSLENNGIFHGSLHRDNGSFAMVSTIRLSNKLVEVQWCYSKSQNCKYSFQDSDRNGTYINDNNVSKKETSTAPKPQLRIFYNRTNNST